MIGSMGDLSWAVFGPMLGRDRSIEIQKGIFLMSMLAILGMRGWQWPA